MVLEGRNPKTFKNAQADRAAEKVFAARRVRAARVEKEIAEAMTELAKANWNHPMVAIDPGDKHVGVATFRDGRCTQAFECTPEEGLLCIEKVLANRLAQTIVVEKFTLYPDKAAEQAGSEMLTSEMIGAIKWQVNRHNSIVESIAAALAEEEAAGEGSSDDVGAGFVDLVMQPAAIQQPTLAVCRHNGIVPLSPKTPGHSRSAELHGYHFSFRGQGLIRGSK